MFVQPCQIPNLQITPHNKSMKTRRHKERQKQRDREDKHSLDVSFCFQCRFCSGGMYIPTVVAVVMLLQ